MINFLYYVLHVKMATLSVILNHLLIKNNYRLDMLFQDLTNISTLNLQTVTRIILTTKLRTCLQLSIIVLKVLRWEGRKNECL